MSFWVIFLKSRSHLNFFKLYLIILFNDINIVIKTKKIYAIFGLITELNTCLY